LRYQPDIVHFSGHGDSIGQIQLLNHAGNRVPVPIPALSSLFKEFRSKIRCVILNACYAEKQAWTIADHIDCVIGMTGQIEDPAAITFAAAFYQALAHGQSVEKAFNLGVNQLELEQFADAKQPKLISKVGNPDQLYFDTANTGCLIHSANRTASCIRIKQIRPEELPAIESHQRLVTIGRAPKNTIQLEDDHVSWEQGQILMRYGGYYYQHLSGSCSSILRRKGEEYLLERGINEEIRLRNQDRLLIGDWAFVIEFDLVNEDSGYRTTKEADDE
jgi:hypothetical protein